MSEQINIQLELETILKAIKNGDLNILAEIIKKLLMADYEIFKQINDLGSQVAQQSHNVHKLFVEVFPKPSEPSEEVDLEDADKS